MQRAVELTRGAKTQKDLLARVASGRVAAASELSRRRQRRGSVFVLGAGRAGRSLARALVLSGVNVVGLHGREPIPRRAAGEWWRIAADVRHGVGDSRDGARRAARRRAAPAGGRSAPTRRGSPARQRRNRPRRGVSASRARAWRGHDASAGSARESRAGGRIAARCVDRRRRRSVGNRCGDEAVERLGRMRSRSRRARSAAITPRRCLRRTFRSSLRRLRTTARGSRRRGGRGACRDRLGSWALRCRISNRAVRTMC